MSKLLGINPVKSSVSSIQKCSKPIIVFISGEKHIIQEDKKASDSKFVDIISASLKSICDINASEVINLNINVQKPFSTKLVPAISIKNYLMRIAYFSQMEESTLILILIYIDRICNYTNIKLTFNNIYKLLITSALVAIKFNEDSHYSLEAYAKIGRISSFELSYLEFHFLLLIKFDLNVDEDLYNKYFNSLLSCQDDSDEEYEEEEKEFISNEEDK
jgi:hypothetical protein